VKERDGARELGIHAVAGGREVDLSEGLEFAVGVLVFLRPGSRGEEEGSSERKREEGVSHENLRLDDRHGLQARARPKIYLVPHASGGIKLLPGRCV
jgi:hypothetical protein